MARSSKLIKHRKSRLLIRVQKAKSFNIPLFHSKSCVASSNKIHLTFIKHMKKRYVDSSNSSLIGEVQALTKEINLCQDRRKFFESQTRCYISEKVLVSLDIKKDLHDKVIAKVMHCGHKMNKKQDFKGLVVVLTVVQTFVGDQVSIHRALEESDLEKAELKDDECLVVTSQSDGV